MNVIKYLERIQITAGVIMLIIFFTAIIIQVLSRYMDISIIWTEEVATYSFIWAIFMGAAVMVNRREHFRFDLLSKKLKGKLRSCLTIVIDSVILLFSTTIFYYGIVATSTFWDYNWTSLPSMKMSYVWISVPIMGLTMMIYSIAHIVHCIKHFNGEEVGE